MIAKSFIEKLNIKSKAGLNRLAFSMAEFLIVLGIIGMVADLTVPELVSSYNDQLTIIKLKRMYAITSNAFALAVVDNGTPDGWGLGADGDQNALSNLNSIMANKFSVLKNCGTGIGCFPEEGYKNIKGNISPDSMDTNTNYTKMVLPDGTLMSFKSLSGNCDADWGTTLALNNVCGTVGIDINGLKAPNTYGVDYFGFVITKIGIVPMGTPDQSVYPYNGFCNMNSNANMNHEMGLSCSAWAILNDNLDYQDCTSLNWNGNRTTCESLPGNGGGSGGGKKN